MTTWTSLYIIGFIAATFLMEESECSVTNRDSLTGGVKTYLEPGGVYWCSAGSGVVHEQIPTVNGKSCIGLQVFIDLPAEHKLSEPSVQLVPPENVPRYQTNTGANTRILAGTGSAINSLVDINVLEVSIPFGSTFQSTLPLSHSSVLIHMLSGSAAVGDAEQILHSTDTASISLTPSSTLIIRNAYDTAKNETDKQDSAGEQLTSTEAKEEKKESEEENEVKKDQKIEEKREAVKLILFTGSPLSQTAVWGGPFLMLNEEQVKDRRRCYEAGEMGTLSPSDVKWPQKR